MIMRVWLWKYDYEYYETILQEIITRFLHCECELFLFFFFFIPVASLYNLKPDDTVTITKIHKDDKDIVQKSVQVDHVTLTIKVRTK